MNISWTELKDARALRGLTQQELADLLGVHHKTIVNWEAKGVPPKAAYKVQRVLGDELSYVQLKAQGPVDLTFEEYRDIQEEQRQRLREAEQLLDDDLPGVLSNFRAEKDLENSLRVEQQQAEYEERLARREALARFDTFELLNEVAQRFRELPQLSIPEDAQRD